MANLNVMEDFLTGIQGINKVIFIQKQSIIPSEFFLIGKIQLKNNRKIDYPSLWFIDEKRRTKIFESEMLAIIELRDLNESFFHKSNNRKL
ncbi:hypothetical protein PB01_17130 [Psychrobacillus glaciei]|uniref:Uncharacterized protein n=1 Tax=Psychrobacillus glaciei TaxID=2283160 RepID=A0A5J6SVQ5_9BACI|nr:hypothetical protein [Psychrobacillus glaciei]QFG00388.1 hypothetical protein PB01_17130 [Psychrobacillus glaciei]